MLSILMSWAPSKDVKLILSPHLSASEPLVGRGSTGCLCVKPKSKDGICCCQTSSSLCGETQLCGSDLERAVPEVPVAQAGSSWHWIHLRLISSLLQAEQASEQRDAPSLWMLTCGGMFIAPGGGWPCSGLQPTKWTSEGQQLGCVGSTLEEVLLHLPKVIPWWLALGEEEGFFLSGVGESVLSVMDS